MKKCLLIIPKHFYSFKDQFKSQLESRGYQVTVANDEYPEGKFGLLMGKLRFPIMRHITFRKYVDQILPNSSFDLTLIFKGRGISTKLIDELKKASKIIIGYNWDSLLFNPSPKTWMNKIDRYCTFDIRDAEKYNINLVELFTTVEDNYIPFEKKYKFSAIFRNHSNRLKHLDHIIKKFEIAPKDIFLYIFEKNIFFKILNFINSPFLYFRYMKYMHNAPLEYTAYLRTIRESVYTLDYAHPKQTGITMRCFDALNMGTKIITNNRYILYSPTFKDCEPMIFDINDNEYNGKINFDRFLTTDKKRTLVDFFDQLLDERHKNE